MTTHEQEGQVVRRPRLHGSYPVLGAYAARFSASTGWACGDDAPCLAEVPWSRTTPTYDPQLAEPCITLTLGEFSSDRPGRSDPNATYRPRQTAVDRRYEKLVVESWMVSVNLAG